VTTPGNQGKKINWHYLHLFTFSPLRKTKNEEMTIRHDDTKFHKALLFKIINLVRLRDLVPLWQKRLFCVDSTFALLLFHALPLVNTLLKHHQTLTSKTQPLYKKPFPKTFPTP
jgi:hypothetical protein